MRKHVVPLNTQVLPNCIKRYTAERTNKEACCPAEHSGITKLYFSASNHFKLHSGHREFAGNTCNQAVKIPLEKYKRCPVSMNPTVSELKHPYVKRIADEVYIYKKITRYTSCYANKKATYTYISSKLTKHSSSSWPSCQTLTTRW